jgi:hypothetical protein
MADNVIQLGELRIRRQEEMRGFLRDKRCHHRQMTWDDNGCIVTCDDCGMQISPYWAMQMLAREYKRAMEVVEAREKRVAEDKSHNLHLIAAKKVEAVWRRRNMAPCCPHCDRGILPEDGLGGAQTNRAFELRARQNGTGYKPGVFKG